MPGSAIGDCRPASLQKDFLCEALKLDPGAKEGRGRPGPGLGPESLIAQVHTRSLNPKL